jgi:hypothetical protein
MFPLPFQRHHLTITDMMELNLRNQKRNDSDSSKSSPGRKQKKNRNRRSSATSPGRNSTMSQMNNGNDENSYITLSECLNNKLILEGFDGYNFWRGSTDMNQNNDTSLDQEEHIFNDDENDDDDNIINMLGNETDSLYSSLTSGTNTHETLQQLMAAIRNGNGGPSGVGGEAWQKMENALKDRQEKFTMMLNLTPSYL